MTDKGREREGYKISSEERQLMVEAGVQFYLKSKTEFGEGWDPALFYDDERFKNLPPQVQAELRAEIEKQEKTEAAPAAEAPEAPEPEKKKKKEKKKKLTDEEIAGLEDEGLKKVLESVASVKEARRFAKVFEKARRAEDAVKALTRAWETHDRQNKKDFNELTKDLLNRIAKVSGVAEAKKFIRERVRSVDVDLANKFALEFATPIPLSATKAVEAPVTPKPPKPDKAAAPAATPKAQRAAPKQPPVEEYQQTVTERMLQDMEESLEDQPALTLWEEVRDEIAFREKMKEEERAVRLRTYRGDTEAEVGSYEHIESALRALDIDLKNPQQAIEEKRKYLEQISQALEKQIAAADLDTCVRLLGNRQEQGALDVSFDHYLESLAVEEVKDTALESERMDEKRWENIFKPLFEGLERLTKEAQQKREELRAAAKARKDQLTALEPKPPAPEKKKKAQAAPKPAASEPRPQQTAAEAERKEEDEQVIADKIGRIKDKIDRALKAKEKAEGKSLEYPASFKFGRAIGNGEYTLLVAYAENPKQRPYILDRDAEACARVVEEYVGEFAQAVEISPDEARARLEALVKEVYDERTAKGGEYIYPNLDPGFNGKRQRLKSGKDDIAALKLAEIWKRVQLPEERQVQFAGLLDFFEAARRLQNEMVAVDLQARRAQREAEQLTAAQQTFERAVTSFIRGREEAASSAQVPKVKYPGEFKFAGALRGGEDAIFALLDAEGAKRRDIVEIGIPAWRKTVEHFLPEFAREVGLSEQEFRDKLDKIIAELQARRKKGGRGGRRFEYKNLDPNGAQQKGREIVSRWTLENLLSKMHLPKDPENTVVEALDYFDALQDLRGRLKTSLRDQRAQARDAQGKRVREMRENRERRLPSFAGEVELDALLWASDKAWWDEDEAGWERAREAVVLYQREHFGKKEWNDERKAALREIMRMVWARREFVVAKKAVGTVGLDSRAACELLKFAGIKTRAIIPLVPPRRKPGAIHVNISGEEGVVSGVSYYKKVKAARESGKIYDPNDPKNNLAQYIHRDKRTLSFDHHNAGISLPDAASVQYLFETLEFLGFFTDKNEHFNKEFTEKFGYTADNLRKALELVMFDDTKAHPAWQNADSAYWKGPWQRSLLAIAARADFKSIVAYVKDHPETDFTEEISEADAKKYDFVQKDGRSLVEKNEETFELAKKHWVELVNNGYSVYTEEVGGQFRELSRYYLVEAETSRLGNVKIVFVEAGEKNKGGYRGGGFPGSIDALRALGGRDVLYLIYNPPYERPGIDRKTYSMIERIFATHTDKDLPEDLFPGGECLRKRMWNYTGKGLEKQASIRAIFEALGVPPEELKKNKALERAMKLEEYDPSKPLTPEEVGLDLEKAKVLREILREELVEKYADEFAKEYPSMAKRGREYVLKVAEDYVNDKGKEELEKKFQRTLHARIQREIAKQRS